MHHLSGLDASFLHFETPETPMHVGSLMLLELPPGYAGDYYEDVKAMIGARLHLATVLTRKLAPMPFELAEPVWIDDDDIDLDYHVRSLTLRRPGTMEQLHQLIGRLHSSLLDRSRPLWEMYVIEGLQDGHVAFYTKAQASPAEDGWAPVYNFGYVREFLAYFRAMGYPLLRSADYPRFDAFMKAMSRLEDTDLVDPATELRQCRASFLCRHADSGGEQRCRLRIVGHVADLHFPVSYRQPKLIAIDKQPDDNVMHPGRSGIADRLAG